MKLRNILIVDDEITHLEAIIDIFEETEPSYQVLQAFNTNTAFDIANKEIPDLIITDWEMPNNSGIELIKKLKSSTNTKDIPVIMCSGKMTSSENLETALKAGAVDYIRKPIDKIELIARTKANLHLADSYTKIKNLNESKDKFFSIIGHDLKGPINSVSSFTFLLKNHIDFITKEEIKTIADDLYKSQDNLYRLLENLLEWSRSQIGLIDFVPKQFNLNELLNENIELLSPQAANKKILISNNTNEDLIICLHKASISTVVRNLISNAIKFTQEHGRIFIEYQKYDKEVVVSVIDNGVGMEEEIIEKIFRIDTKYSTNGTAKEKGTGLGLILCKEFVEKNGGSIWVESKKSDGSKFKFSLPIE